MNRETKRYGPPVGDHVRLDRIDRISGTRIQVLDLSHPDSEFAPEWIVESRDTSGNPVRVRLVRWASVCVDHASRVCHERLEDARLDAGEPGDWCSECRAASAD